MSKIDNLAVNTIRVLSAEAIQKANSGHPGLPIGSAPLAYTLWSKHLKHNPKDSKWDNRDRFILSAGHASMLLYSLLHMFGYKVSMEDIKNFRQFDSLTPGHPEHGLTDGVEATSGPLGQGIAMAVGFAMAEAHLGAEFNKPDFDVVDHYTYALSGDGCLQEGVSGEASSLAGTLKLGKLIVLYDKNDITIEGSIDTAFDEDVKKRYQAYGWQVLEVEDGNEDLNGISAAIEQAKAEKEKPSLIIVKTAIAYGSPKQGSESSHGSPLGQENIDAMKKNFGWEHTDPFFVPEEVKSHIAELCKAFEAEEDQWKAMFDKYRKAYPELAEKYNQYMTPVSESVFDEDYWAVEDKAVATRQSSGDIINKLAKRIPNLIGGSADLAPANNSLMKDRGFFSAQDRLGTNIHFGIREFAMTAICNGMMLHGGLVPYCATFLVFSDYMKGAIRMAALMELPVTYVLTHDSIGVGEDGATHEPIEHLTALRATPGVHMWRPADGHETAAAYKSAMTAKAPSAIALSRQPLPQFKETGKDALRGAYILKDGGKTPDVILIGTGSEVSLCMSAAEELAKQSIAARVVSMPCMELFEEQDASYKESVLPNSVRARVAVEAATSYGWAKYVGLDGGYVTIDHFGASAPAPVLFEKFGFTTEAVVAKAKEVLGK
ncbi:MAG: transketolase [Christensenella sp.]|uniref:transketolase n=1 Tax=Christensenella sp. TaxID=1935934 RepID=UPI002B21D02F|nr:transketolase [Christensenella sp.]MEA5004158.1 transketolase [Christensenella sp.]